MAYNYEYPYVDPNRYNSDWLLHEMKRVADEYDRLVSEFEIIKSEFEIIKNRVDAIDAHLEEIDQHIIAIDDALFQHQSAIATLRNLIIQYSEADKLYALELVNQLKAEMIEDLNDIRDLIETFNAYMRDPLSLEDRPLAWVITANYERERYGGMNDAEFTALNMTVDQYDGYALTAAQWALDAKRRLTDNWLRRTTNPLTGKKDTTYNAIDTVFNYIIHSPDVTEFDSQDKDVATWDAMNLTVLGYLGI